MLNRSVLAADMVEPRHSCKKFCDRIVVQPSLHPSVCLTRSAKRCLSVCKLQLRVSHTGYDPIIKEHHHLV